MSDDLNVLVAAFDEFTSRTGRQVRTLVRATGQLAERVMKTEAPVRFGFLRGSIRVVDEGPYSVSVGPTVDYAGYVAYGTRRQRPNPYDLRTAEQVGPVFQANADAIAAAAHL